MIILVVALCCHTVRPQSPVCAGEIWDQLTTDPRESSSCFGITGPDPSKSAKSKTFVLSSNLKSSRANDEKSLSFCANCLIWANAAAEDESPFSNFFSTRNTLARAFSLFRSSLLRSCASFRPSKMHSLPSATHREHGAVPVHYVDKSVWADAEFPQVPCQTMFVQMRKLMGLPLIFVFYKADMRR